MIFVVDCWSVDHVAYSHMVDGVLLLLAGLDGSAGEAAGGVLGGPRFAEGAGEHFVGLFVVYEALGGGVPLEVATEAEADVAEVDDRAGTVGLFDGGDGLLAGDDAIDEVAGVVCAAVDAAVMGAGFVVEERKGVGFYGTSVDPDGAFGALEGDSLADPAGVDECDTGRVDGFEVEVGGGIPEGFFGPSGLAVFDGDGAGEFGAHAPLGDVGMVAAPVGDLAAGVVEDRAEVDVATAGGVGGGGGGAEPHIVVESGAWR